MFTLMLSVRSTNVISKNHESLSVEVGEEMILICTADVEALACVFRGPYDSVRRKQSYSMLMIKGAKYENDRVQQYGIDKEDCGMKITSVDEYDYGEWECSITGKNKVNGNLEEAKGFIQVNVGLGNGSATPCKIGGVSLGMAVLLVLYMTFA